MELEILPFREEPTHLDEEQDQEDQNQEEEEPQEEEPQSEDILVQSQEQE